jgi:His/Glu/Gln/Arg/opine family amino acid ABC transporter permease subunit
VTALVAYSFRWDVVSGSFGILLRSVKVTLELSALSLVLSLVLGLIVALCRLSPFGPLRWLAFAYIQVFRALSLYIYVLLLYYGIAAVSGINFSPLEAGVIALTVLNSAYMAEIYRSALGAVERGQREAAFSLGFSLPRAFGTVVFPQAFRIALPPLTNQFVDIVKDSSIIAVIGTTDLMGTTNQLNGIYRAPFELYTTVAFFYITLVLVLSAAAALLERRLNRHVR